MRKKPIAKIISMLLFLCVFANLGILPFNAAEYDGTTDSSWYVAGETEYVVSTAAEFAAIATIVNNGTDTFKDKTIKLGANIVFNEGEAENFATSAPEYAFTPIGNGTSQFKGTFDGQGHTISGIYINGAADTGLFGQVNGATIKNFALINSYIKGTERIGAIVGRVRETGTTFSDLYVNAYIKSSAAPTGGICGSILNYAEGNIFERCVFAGEVNSSSSNAGGILGSDEFARNASNAAKTIPTKIIDCIVTGIVRGPAGNAGGIVGNLFYTEVIRCINAGQVYCNGYHGGIGGAIRNILSEAGTPFAKVTDSYSCTDVLKGVETYRGVIGGNNQAGITTGCDAILSTAIVGNGSAEVLEALDFDGEDAVWTVTRYGYPLPKSVNAMVSGYVDLKFKAVQNTNVADGLYDIRFISVVNSLNFESVGYTITASYGDNQLREYKNISTSKVYTSLNAKNDSTGSVIPVTAAELDGNYFIALTITDVPASAGQIEFTVKVFAVSDGVVYYSPAEKVIYNAGEFQS